MKIVFNNTIFFHQRYGGISRYITCLANQLIKNGLDVKIVAPLFKNIYLNQIPKKNIIGKYIKRFPPLKIFEFYSDYIFEKYINKHQPRIVHDTYYSKNLLSCKNSAKIVTMHDLIHKKFPHYYDGIKKRLLLTKILNDVDYFICVSRNTQKDLIDYYNVPENKTSVIYHGAEHLNKAEIKNKPNILEKPYVLYIGSRSRYKNFNIIPKAFSESKFKNEFNIVCFGGNAFSDKEKNYFKKLNFDQNQIIQIDGNDEVLFHLYSNARTLIFPSIYEGFGLPLVESMYCGCPIISSNTSVMPEICGNAAEYFNPYNSEELSVAINKIVYSDNCRLKLINNSKSNVKKFTWKKCAEKTINVYNKFIF